jgi:hypothetical protein
MMRLKKYLLYLLILIIAGAIAVSIFFALKSGKDNDRPAEETALEEGESSEKAENTEQEAKEAAPEEEAEEVIED